MDGIGSYYSLGTIVGLSFALGSPLEGRVIVDQTDFDIVFEYSSGSWDTYVLDTLTDEVYAPDDVYLRMNEHSIRPRPEGANFDFLGPAGSLQWVIPQADPGFPYESLYGAIEVDAEAGTFVDNQAVLTFSSIDTPEGGHLHLWIEDVFGNPALIFTTDSEYQAPNVFQFDELSLDDHVHFNWAFTSAGVYGIDIRIDAELIGGGWTTIERNVQFEVVPEPSVFAFAGGIFSLGFAAAYRVRRRRQSRFSPGVNET